MISVFGATNAIVQALDNIYATPLKYEGDAATISATMLVKFSRFADMILIQRLLENIQHMSAATVCLIQ